jgi:hypothetical protein
LINREVYEKDPSQNRLLNQGTAKVTSGLTDPELETLRYEITSFVCDGQYAQGLERILRTYLTYLETPEQPAVWVSGFYGSGKEGTKVRKQFAGPPYGWPQDAIDAALIVLHTAGMLQARLGGEPVAKGKLDQKNITTTEFRVEHVTLSKVELIQLRGLFGKAGLTIKPGQEAQVAPEFLSRMAALGDAAGGDTPLPKRPDLVHLQDLAQRVGNDQLKAIHDQKDGLAQEITDWKARAEKIAHREPRWRELLALFKHAHELPVAAAVQAEVAAIEQSRTLLSDPDPVPGMVQQVTQALRDALNDARARCEATRQEGFGSLSASNTWSRLKPEDRDSLTKQFQLDHMPAIKVGSTEEVLGTPQAMKLAEWETLCDALPTRFGQALAAAAKLLEPKAQHVKLTGGTIRNEDDLTTWLRSAEEQIRTKLREGPVIL